MCASDLPRVSRSIRGRRRPPSGSYRPSRGSWPPEEYLGGALPRWLTSIMPYSQGRPWRDAILSRAVPGHPIRERFGMDPWDQGVAKAFSCGFGSFFVCACCGSVYHVPQGHVLQICQIYMSNQFWILHDSDIIYCGPTNGKQEDSPAAMEEDFMWTCMSVDAVTSRQVSCC